MAELGVDFKLDASWRQEDGRRRSLTYDFTEPLIDDWNTDNLSLAKEHELYKISVDGKYNFPDPLELFQGLNLSQQMGEEVTFEGLTFRGVFNNMQAWKPSYQRNYRKVGGKSIRCFPYCSPVHQSCSFCGDSLKFNVSAENILISDPNLKFCLVAQFCSTLSAVPIGLGSTVSREEFNSRISSKDSATWWTGSTIDTTKNRKRFKLSEFSATQITNGISVEFNKEKRSWFCEAGTPDTKHTVKVLVFSLPQFSDHYRCVAAFDSPSFHLHPKKPKSTANVLSFQRKGSKRNFQEISFKDDFSEALESFGSDDFDLEQVTTLDDFDLEELDRCIKPQSLSRKRSFLDKSIGDQSSASTPYPEEELFVGSLSSPSTGLKKLRSARDVKLNALDDLLDDFVPSQEIFRERETKISFSAPPLARCASAPTIKLNSDNEREVERRKQNAHLVAALFLDVVSQNKANRFVKIVTKFLTSENETLTNTLQKLLKSLMSHNTRESDSRDQATTLLDTCFQFLEKNFPPFKVYCRKQQERKVEGLDVILANLVKFQYGYVPSKFSPSSAPVSYTLHSLMNNMKGSWNIDAQQLRMFYQSMNLSETIVDCYANMLSSFTIDFEPDTHTMIVKKKEKLFSSGMQRIVFDGIQRDWTLADPLLMGNPFHSYCCRVGPTEEELVLEVYLHGGCFKSCTIFRLLDGCLEVSQSVCQKVDLCWQTCYRNKVQALRAM